MGYIDKAFYDTMFGANIDQVEFDMLNEIASQIVNRRTLNKINHFGITNFSNTLQDRIKKATAYQVRVLVDTGGMDNLSGMSDLNADSVTIGKYSESSGGQGNFDGSKIKVVDGVTISPMIDYMLHMTGLLYTGSNATRLEDLNELNP